MAMRPEGGGILRRRKLGKALDDISGKPFSESIFSWPVPGENGRRLGRPSALSNAELLQRRDQLLGIFAAHWPTVGWNLQRVRELTQVQLALRPLTDFKNPTIELLQWNTSAKARPDGVLRHKQERKRLEGELADVENRFSAANKRVVEGEEAFEQAQNRFAVARDGYCYARKKRKKKTAKSLMKERAKWSSLCQKVHAELNRRKESLKERNAELSEIRKRIADLDALFSQTELLRFVLSERYAFTPLNFANAAAGLPQMSWRNSFKLCLGGPCSAETSVNCLIVEAVKTVLERACPTSADKAVDEIRRRISKEKQFEKVREYVGEHWSALNDAILAGWSSAGHADARPYHITSLFLAALKVPKRVVNPLLNALEKDFSDA
jgi:hypothetical protein